MNELTTTFCDTIRGRNARRSLSSILDVIAEDAARSLTSGDVTTIPEPCCQLSDRRHPACWLIRRPLTGLFLTQSPSLCCVLISGVERRFSSVTRLPSMSTPCESPTTIPDPSVQLKA